MVELKESIGNSYLFNVGLVNTGNLNKVTDIMNGFLEYICIDTSNQISLTITNEDGVTIYEQTSMTPGLHFLPIRYQAINEHNERINYSNCKWLLNGKLTFDIKGINGTNVEVKIKYA